MQEAEESSPRIVVVVKDGIVSRVYTEAKASVLIVDLDVEGGDCANGLVKFGPRDTWKKALLEMTGEVSPNHIQELFGCAVTAGLEIERN